MAEDWARISREAAESQPVFIVGVERSGTTALRNTLERHPTFRPKGAFSNETKLFGHVDRLFEIFDDPSERLFKFYQRNRACAEAMLSAARRCRDQGGESTDLYRLFFHFAQIARAPKRLLEKTPAHLRYLGEMYAAFPRLRVVVCLRHPVEVLSSYRKRLKRHKEEGEFGSHHNWLTITAQAFGRKFNALFDAMEQFRRHHAEPLLLVQYEELTNHPRTVLKRIFDFLEEPFDPSSMFEAVDLRRDPHGSPCEQAQLVPNHKDWRECLDEKEATVVEEIANPTMDLLGYRRYTSS